MLLAHGGSSTLPSGSASSPSLISTSHSSSLKSRLSRRNLTSGSSMRSAIEAIVPFIMSATAEQR